MTSQLPPFRIDAYYPDHLAQFASQMEHVSPERQQRLQAAMNDTESKEFYKGLLSGYAASYALLQQIPVDKIVEEIGIITAFLAAKVRKMKSIDLPGDV